ncbi:MAG: hypothetical protein A3I68_05210 [Candidatus Melainabacteria bacterium RIFCSPLOWO2_02_FULL_35_15]|nr:MAG: hypothetical protein A3F80_07520 [Candidatus Melainabacteria bacterium RIFCSPLOWO2_12_FULL_35_11]OGI12849.1 MAG: hypothetical protein A3I68_05210 [Candidatus Melainabacteria bacterium RIFCSPLOWO2_02_FULL_35_15]
MEPESKIKLDNIIKELTGFLERDFSSRFRNLTNKEDRQLFFLAKILTQLKQISNESGNKDKKIVRFPALQRIK